MKVENKINRCGWCGEDELYIKYHDEEWGKLVKDDRIMFEFIVLEAAQAGLSWLTILRRREGYRQAFHNFDVQKVAKMTHEEIENLMLNEKIIRNRLKINSTVTNAQHFIEIQNEFGSFSNYLKSFFSESIPIINKWKNINEVPTTTSFSIAISKDMKKRGFKFFGATICQAFLQAVGYLNDHTQDCWCSEKI